MQNCKKKKKTQCKIRPVKYAAFIEHTIPCYNARVLLTEQQKMSIYPIRTYLWGEPLVVLGSDQDTGDAQQL